MAGVDVDPGWHMGRAQREGWSWIPRYRFGSRRGKSKMFGTIYFSNGVEKNRTTRHGLALSLSRQPGSRDLSSVEQDYDDV